MRKKKADTNSGVFRELVNTIRELKESIDFFEEKQATVHELNPIINKLDTIAKKLEKEEAVSRQRNNRLNKLSDLFLQYTLMNFSEQAPISSHGDEIDAISVGVNTLVDELQYLVQIEKENSMMLEIKNQHLEESQQMLNTIFENAPDAVIVVGNDGTILQENPKAVLVFGVNNEKLYGKKLYSLIKPNKYIEEHLGRTRSYKDRKGNRRGNILEVEVLTNDAKCKTLSIGISEPVVVNDERIFICFVKDITKNKKDQDKLKNVITQLTEAEELAHIGSWEWVIDSNQVNWSDELFRIYGCNPGQFTPNISSASVHIHPDDKSNVAEANRLAYEKRVPYNISYRIIRVDGTVRTVEEKCKIIYDEKEKPIKLFGTVYDITEQKEFEKALKASEQKFNLAFKLSPAGIIITESNGGKFVDFNDSFLLMTGYTHNDLDASTPFKINLFNSEDWSQIQNELREFGVVRSKEITFFKKSGERRTFLFSIQPIDINEVACELIIIYDITIRKNVERELENRTNELRRSNAELEQFAYVASHDLQEPLRTITSYVQLLAKRYKNELDQDANDFINFAVDGSNRMRNLINSLLEYSRANRAKPFEIFSVEEQLKEIEDDLKLTIKETGASIDYKNIPNIYGDAVLISRLFYNLISNALKFKGTRNPQIEIKCEESKDDYLFSIKDNGIGIQQEYNEKIFVIFQQLHSKGKYPGTGIGLAICKKIVEKHNGKIWVESELGIGSVFYFTISKKFQTPV